jgi:tRNA (guanine-N7-)-methyltransferase
VHLATDWEEYAFHMLEVLLQEPTMVNTATAADGFAPRPEYRGSSSFERKGLAKGHGVWDLVFIKR